MEGGALIRVEALILNFNQQEGWLFDGGAYSRGGGGVLIRRFTDMYLVALPIPEWKRCLKLTPIRLVLTPVRVSLVSMA